MKKLAAFRIVYSNSISIAIISRELNYGNRNGISKFYFQQLSKERINWLVTFKISGIDQFSGLLSPDKQYLEKLSASACM